MKKNFIIGAIAVVLILFAFASFGAAPKKAAGLSLFQYKSGYFTNYVETPSYQEKWTSSTKMSPSHTDALKLQVQQKEHLSCIYKLNKIIKEAGKRSKRSMPTKTAQPVSIHRNFHQKIVTDSSSLTKEPKRKLHIN